MFLYSRIHSITLCFIVLVSSAQSFLKGWVGGGGAVLGPALAALGGRQAACTGCFISGFRVIICSRAPEDPHALHGQVATKVAEEALSQGLGGIQKPAEGLHKFITERMWDPSKASLNLSRDVGH